MKPQEHSSFQEAHQQAGRYARDRGKADRLLQLFFRKAAHEEGKLRQVWEDLMTLGRMLRSWQRGAYRVLPWRTLLWSLTAVLYFVDPLDLVPDFVPGLGYLDDAAVIGFIMKSIRKDVERFKFWEADNRRDHGTG